MQRVACVYVPNLLIQRLMHDCPAWSRQPLAVVAGAQPTAPIVGLNAKARALHLQEGMPLSAAQGITHELNVVQYDRSLAAASMQTLWRAMLALTPNVEPDAAELGVLWLDPSGLDGLFQSLPLWAAAVHQAVLEAGYTGQVVVGFNRYLALALARTRRGWHVIPDVQREAVWARAVPLAALGISPTLRAAAQPLGLRTLNDLLQFDAATVRQRLGAEAQWLYHMALGRRVTPLRPKRAVVPCAVQQSLEPAETDVHRLLFVIKAMLTGLVQQVQRQKLAIQVLDLKMVLEHCAAICLHITPAEPTCDSMLLLDLIRLRLGAHNIAAPICQLHITGQTVAFPAQQILLLTPGLHPTSPRSLIQAAQALARLKAAFGAHAVTRARLCLSHVPERRFVWQATCDVALPRLLDPVAKPPLIRRMQALPMPLRRGKWATARVRGPYRLHYGWWSTRIERDYFYVETQAGRIVWLFHDLVRRQWCLHGEID